MAEDDENLFRDAIGDVRRIQIEDRVTTSKRPAPSVKMAERDEAFALIEFRLGLDSALIDAESVLSYRSEAISKTIFGKLKRGEYSPGAELDLHGYSISMAQRELPEFLRQARKQQIACVRIIHGRGEHSEDGISTLKTLVDHDLRHRQMVLAFHSSPRAQGGTGAVNVLLKTR